MPPTAKESLLGRWWSQPAGGREVLIVALPLVVSSLSWTVMTFFDRLLLKHHSGEAMSAAFTASTVWFAVLCLPLGMTMYTTTFVSQYFGAGRHERIGPSVWQGVWLALLVSPLLLLAIPIAPAIFSLAGHSEVVTAHEITYFQILCWGAPALIIAQALAAFYGGRGQTRVMMVVDTSVALLNLLLDYLWIFGHAGFPAWGIAGAGWATVAALWIKALIYLLLFLQRHHRIRYGTITGMKVDRELFGRLIYYGGPSGWQLVLDVGGFTMFVVLVGRLGAVQQEATSMAFSISTLAFMPIWGFAQSAAILVGQHLGENREQLAARATWTSLHVALAYMSAISLLYIFAPDIFLGGFFGSGQTSVDRDQVRPLAEQLLKYVAAYNLLDAAAMVFVSAIKGAGDTLFVLGVSAVMSLLLTVASWLAVQVLGLNIYGCWVIISAWITLMGVIFMARFLGGQWRRMRVIEPVPPDLLG
jgi:multidrug resistance protein, MATE family